MSRPVLYLDCSSGISGDMTVAALLDLGADCSVLSDALASLPLSGYYVEIRDTFKSGIRACDFNVILENENHDHDMEYLHGHSHDGNVPPDAPHDHHGTPDAPHGHSHGTPGTLHDHSHSTPDTPHDHSHSTPDTPHDHSHGAPGTPRSHVPENIPNAEPHIHEPAHVHEQSYTHESAHVHDQPHTHEPAHVHEQPHTHEPAHVHDQPHTHDHAPMHDQPHTHEPAHTHAHTARNLQDITEIIRAGRLTESARELALRIFHILAEAEASVHGKSIDEVHFHEVGAVDSIVDIVAAAVCLDNLQPEYVVISPLTDGTGQIRCQHGLIPVPVPAVAAIAEQNQLVLKIADIEGELVTPTGAAIAAALQSGRHLPTEFRIVGTGFGAGKRDYAASGLLRAMLVEPVSGVESESAAGMSGTAGSASGTPGALSVAPAEMSGVVGSAFSTPDALSVAPAEMSGAADPEGTILSLETNIDDCSGEALAFTMQSLLDNGALDVFYIPIYMKKNRPAYLLRVLCRAKDRPTMESIIFRNTTTIGIRFQEVQRTRLPRRIVTVETPWGTADVKCCSFEGNTFYYPESDSVSRLARAHQIGFHEMYHLVQDYACRNIS